ncbi:hypothetical protein F5Y17DRAFT_78619 [Xylariaceae sp. FL0594]|nr:hypothetical protein F5Y17DRAFT_78619 [Xylariaceae sp. FL0594]
MPASHIINAAMSGRGEIRGNTSYNNTPSYSNYTRNNNNNAMLPLSPASQQQQPYNNTSSSSLEAENHTLWRLLIAAVCVAALIGLACCALAYCARGLEKKVKRMESDGERLRELRMFSMGAGTAEGRQQGRDECRTDDDDFDNNKNIGVAF